MSLIEKIRERIRIRDYYLSLHAEQELAEDGFDRRDMEHASLTGFVEKKMTHDIRSSRYRVEGVAKDGRLMRVICRFTEVGPVVIITVYEKD